MTFASIEQLALTARADDPTGLGLAEWSLDLAPGGQIALIGEQGSGADLLPQLLVDARGGPSIAAGAVWFEGPGREREPLRQFGKRPTGGIVHIPQDPRDAFDPNKPLGRQMTAQIRRATGLGSAEAARAAEIWMARLGVKNPSSAARIKVRDGDPGLISRAVLASLMSTEPKLIVGSAPFTVLSQIQQTGLLGLLRRECRAREIALVLATSDLAIAAEMADYAAVFYAGQVVEEGPVRTILGDPRHPYTAALLRGLPEHVRPNTPLTVLEGQAPRRGTVPAGCPFHPRCAQALAGCYIDPPELTVEGARQFRCSWPLGAK